MKSLLPLIVLFACQTGAQPPQNPFKSDPQAADAGRASFRLFCSPCHGIRAEGGRGPDLSRGVYTAGETDADLFNAIANGVPGTEMPSFSANLGDETIWRMVSYLRSIARRDVEKATGDRASGEKLFWGKGGCGGCHRVGTRGSRMGPDLTRIGRTRSMKHLRDSVISPNEDLTPGFNTITVVTRAGKKIVGVQRGFDNFSAQLMDAQENYYSFFKSDVASAKREFRSIMPDGYGKMLSKQELDDLVAYMTALDAKP